MMVYRKTVEKGLKPAELHNAAYALLQEVLRTDWNCPEVVIEKTALGKPYIHGREDLHVSLSHTDGLVCCAVSKQPVGVDCEPLRTVPQRVLQRVCTPLELEAIPNAPDPEMRALALWTLKESISKKRGVGMFVAPGAKEAILAKRREKFAAEYLAPMVREAKLLGLDANTLTSMIDAAYKEEKDE